ADIWSFGITALELAHGHAPFSKFPPMKVLLMTIQNAPPELDYDRDKRFSKSFKEMVAMCLVKDPTKRPTAEKLLKHSFFKAAKSPEITVKNLLAGLAPLWDRVKALQLKDAAQLALRRMPSAEEEALSQIEYKRGVSAWNFDIEDLKNQASLIQEDEELSGMKEDGNFMPPTKKDPSNSRMDTEKSVLKGNTDQRSVINGSAAEQETRGLRGKNGILDMNLPNNSCQVKTNVHEPGKLLCDLNSFSKKDSETNQLRSNTMRKPQTDKRHTSDRYDSEIHSVADRYKREIRKAPSFSGPLMLPTRASANSLSAPTAPLRSAGGFRDTLEEKSKVQIKGRFSVTSENVDLVKDIPICTVPRKTTQGSPLRKSASVGDCMDPKQTPPASQSNRDIGNVRLPASILVPHLQNLHQQTSFQRDIIMNLLNSIQQIEQSDGVHSNDDVIVEQTASEREQLLLMKISEMQARVSNLTDELTAEKVKFVQLQQQVNSACFSEEDKKRDEKEV
ncbi:Kinase, partial [Zostera marina]